MRCQTKDLDCNLEVWRKDEFVTEDEDSLNCLAQCKCGEFIALEVELYFGVVTGEYKIISSHNYN